MSKILALASKSSTFGSFWQLRVLNEKQGLLRFEVRVCNCAIRRSGLATIFNVQAGQLSIKCSLCSHTTQTHRLHKPQYIMPSLEVQVLVHIDPRRKFFGTYQEIYK